MEKNNQNSSLAANQDFNELLRIENLDLIVNENEKSRVLSKGISLSLKKGEIVPLVGPSGCGKSTLLRAIVRFFPYQNGNIYFKNSDIQHLTPAELRTNVTLLLQKASFDPGTVKENLLTPFSFKNVKRDIPDKNELKDCLSKCSLPEKILESDISKLSGGEAQRVSLARTMLLNPTVVLLDEPTSNLDEESSAKLVSAIKEWVKDGEHAVLWIVHEREVLKMIGQVAIKFTENGLRAANGKVEVKDGK